MDGRFEGIWVYESVGPYLVMAPEVRLCTFSADILRNNNVIITLKRDHNIVLMLEDVIITLCVHWDVDTLSCLKMPHIINDLKGFLRRVNIWVC